jgi:hypothetical protein
MLGKEWWLKDPYREDVERLRAHAVASERSRLRAMVERQKELLKDSYMIAVINTGGDELMQDELRKISKAVLRALNEILKGME